MGRKLGAGAAASHLPGSADVVSLTDRRKDVLARLARAELARTIAELEQTVDHRGAQIAESKRKHPSNPRVYDREGET